MRKRSLSIGLVIIVIVAGLLLAVSLSHKAAAPASSASAITKNKIAETKTTSDTTDKQSTAPAIKTAQQSTFNKQQYSLTDPASPWIIVNKHRPLSPKDYAPQLAMPTVGLRLAASNPEMQVSTQAKASLEQLFAGAKQAGYDLIIASGYRSYTEQISVYNAEVKNYGQATADTESARPGYSEHQTGLAVDIGAASRKCEVQQCFAGMPEGQWLAAHAHDYGFVIRYTKDSKPVTGYTYEPWHIRYVGTALAAEIHNNSDEPLETFFGLEPAADYQ